MTKRCKNCGWLNDDNSLKCEKCSTSLDSGMVGTSSPSYQPSSGSSGDNLRKTVSENHFFSTEREQSGKISGKMESACPHCGYLVREGMKLCPECGNALGGTYSNEHGICCPNCGKQNPTDAKFCTQCGGDLNERKEPLTGPKPKGNSGNRQGTINPWMKPEIGAFCTLRPISWEGEDVNHDPLSFSGNPIVLNRANTDPNNQSITSNEQAELTCEDGEWYIVDKSVLHTTYVLASEKIRLKKGDIIVLGNRLFEFN